MVSTMPLAVPPPLPGAPPNPVIEPPIDGRPAGEAYLRLVSQNDAPAATSAQAVPGSHVLAYRASLPILGRRYYIACFVGREQRPLQRLAAESQHKSWAHTLVTLFAIAAGISVALMSTIAAAYLAKSMLGIDLSDDHFILHHLFFN